MMKSVALTESYFVHGDDNDYVVVDAPVVSRNHVAFDVMTSIYDDVHDGSTTASSIDDNDDIEGKDTDDASYDYCDEFLTVEKFQNPSTNTDDTAVPFEIDLSLVVDDDVESVCLPSITGDDATDIVVATDQCATDAADDEVQDDIDEPVHNSNSNMSELSMTKEEEEKNTTTHVKCSEADDVPKGDRTHPDPAVTEDINEDVSPSSESTNPPPITLMVNNDKDSSTAHSSKTTVHSVMVTLTGTDTEANHSELFNVELPSQDDSRDTKPVQSVASETKPTTQDDGGWIESSSRSRRLSNKKRRKQMKLAKRTATMMANLSSSPPPNTSTKGLVLRRCGGKQVTPIIVEMSNTVIGM